MKQDLEQRISNHRNFAAVFFPQISHLPYPDVPQNEHDRAIRKRARGILEVEDGWLGQVMELLQRYGELENTTGLSVNGPVTTSFALYSCAARRAGEEKNGIEPFPTTSS